MGGDAFWNGVILWMTAISIVGFAALVAVTRLVLRAMGKNVGWGRSALYVCGAFVALQLAGSLLTGLYYYFQ